MVELQPSKLVVWVRFPSSAPYSAGSLPAVFLFYFFSGGAFELSKKRRKTNDKKGIFRLFYPDDSALCEALQRYFGHSSFRPGQLDIVRALTAGRDVLAVMPTGAGKSICYQLPALLREGVCLVVSPLIALMQDQVQRLIQNGVRAAYINSALTENQCRKALQNAAQGMYRIVYAAPERLMTPSFLHFATSVPISLVCIDEAHCISHWGPDFRPGYQRIAEFLSLLPQRPPVGAFTATATPRVREDILQSLQLSQPLVTTSGFDRPNLFFEVHQYSREEKLQALKLYLSQKSSASGIVYCSTRKAVDELWMLLTAEGYRAARYHAGLSLSERQTAQEGFLCGQASLMIATNAFGMGVDKPDVRFVIHYNLPLDLESYYQEAGRAGRDGLPAECILFYTQSDVRTNHFLIENSSAETAQQDAQKKRLSDMIQFCFTQSCLRRTLLRYFGEAYGRSCGHCGSCAPRAQRASLSRMLAKETRQKSPAVDSRLWCELDRTRKLLAHRESRPAFTIASDAVLTQLCLQRPSCLRELYRIPGMTQTKAEAYGKDFLKVIAAFS